MRKRSFDLLFSLAGALLLSPVFVLIAAWISLDSKGGVVYRQNRVGLNGKDFALFKFRSMRTGSDKQGLLTIGGRDSRITRSGYFLRKYKLDELPQLFNVIKGDMSLVGPRPEVRKYVDLYTAEQKAVLGVRPGITDFASIEYSNENELLASSENPEKMYVEEVMPLKLALNLRYIREQGAWTDFKIICRTLLKIMN
jgi:lipopolysaccharide/colanic/teichoic acid biosynthesis glycosyltransferase